LACQVGPCCLFLCGPFSVSHLPLLCFPLGRPTPPRKFFVWAVTGRLAACERVAAIRRVFFFVLYWPLLYTRFEVAKPALPPSVTLALQPFDLPRTPSQSFLPLFPPSSYVFSFFCSGPRRPRSQCVHPRVEFFSSRAFHPPDFRVLFTEDHEAPPPFSFPGPVRPHFVLVNPLMLYFFCLIPRSFFKCFQLTPRKTFLRSF